MLSSLLYQCRPVVIGVETFHVWTQWGLKDCRHQQILADAQVNTYYSKSNSQCGARTLPALCDVVAFQAVALSTALWQQIWRFNHSVIVCLVRFFFGVMWGQNKKDGIAREELHLATIHKINSIMAGCSKVWIDWVSAISALWKGLCTERRLAKSWPLF